MTKTTKATKMLALSLLAFIALTGCNLPRPENQPGQGLVFPTLPGSEVEEPIPATGSCLIGNWELDPPEKKVLVDLLRNEVDQEVELSNINGEIGVQFSPDGRVTLLSDAVRARGRFRLNGRNLPATVRLDGWVDGQYETNDGEDQLTLSADSLNNLDIGVTVIVIPVYSSTAAELVDESYLDGSVTVPYTCDSERMSVTVDLPESGTQQLNFERVP